MKNCAVILDLLPLYLDHMVSDETREFIEEHLNTCDTCRKYTQDLQKELQSNPDIPEDKEEIKELRQFKRFLTRRTFRAVLLSVICITILVIALSVYLNHQLRYISFEEAGLSIMDNNQDEVIFSDAIHGNYRWITEISRDTGTLTIHFEQTLWDRYIDGIVYPFDHTIAFLKKDSIKVIYVNKDNTKTTIWEATEDEKSKFFSTGQGSLG